MAKRKSVPREPKGRSPHMRGAYAKRLVQMAAQGVYFLIGWRFAEAGDIFEKLVDMCRREADRIDRTPMP